MPVEGITLDGQHLQALVSHPSFRALFPGVGVSRAQVASCCGRQLSSHADLRAALLSMSERQADRVKAALGVPLSTPLTVRLVTRDRVQTRTF